VGTGTILRTKGKNRTGKRKGDKKRDKEGSLGPFSLLEGAV